MPGEARRQPTPGPPRAGSCWVTDRRSPALEGLRGQEHSLAAELPGPGAKAPGAKAEASQRSASLGRARVPDHVSSPAG